MKIKDSRLRQFDANILTVSVILYPLILNQILIHGSVIDSAVWFIYSDGRYLISICSGTPIMIFINCYTCVEYIWD